MTSGASQARRGFALLAVAATLLIVEVPAVAQPRRRPPAPPPAPAEPPPPADIRARSQLSQTAAWIGDPVDFIVEALQELENFFGLLGFVAMVVLPQDGIGREVHDDRLDGRRADVHSNEEAGGHAGEYGAGTSTGQPNSGGFLLFSWD